MAQIIKEPIENFYEVGEELGRGRFAVVRKCKSKKNGEVYAGKFVRKARQGRSGREQLLLEIDILHTSRHPKMVRLYDVFETRTEMVLVIEYAPGGDLHRHCLEQVETVRTEKEICHLIRQIVEAVRYLHENNVVHLDLKPENILLKTDSRFPEIRLIDFGLSRRLDVPYSQFDIVGTPEYVAPEVLAYEPLDVNADMWSIGVVTYVLLSGISPFAGDDVMETYANIGQVEYDFDAEEFDDISDEAKDFIDGLLIRQQKKRMSSREALEHPWLKQLEDGIKPEDIADAIKAESIIPTDVLAKAAELNPVQEEMVSDAESEDCLSRDSVSSPEEEPMHEETKAGGKDSHPIESCKDISETPLKDIAEPLKDISQPSKDVSEPLKDVSRPTEVSSESDTSTLPVEAETIVETSAADKTKSNPGVKVTLEEPESAGQNSVPLTNVVLPPNDTTQSHVGEKPKESSVDHIVSDAKSDDSVSKEVADQLEPAKDLKKECIKVSNENVQISLSSGLPEVTRSTDSGENPSAKLEVEPKSEPSEHVAEDMVPSEDTKVSPATDDALNVEEPCDSDSTPSKEKRSNSFALYDTLISGLKTEERKEGTDENMNESEAVPQTPVERKKSKAIDIDAILGFSDSPKIEVQQPEKSSNEVSPVKKTFNIDSIIGSGKDEVPSGGSVASDEVSKPKSVEKQASTETGPHKDKSPKVKAAASVFDKESGEKSEVKSKQMAKNGRPDDSWKSPASRNMRHSLDMHEPKPKATLEKSRSADTSEEENMKITKSGSLPNHASKSGSGELGSSSRPSSFGSGSKLQVQGTTNKIPSPCDDVKTVRHGIAAKMASKFSEMEANIGKEHGKAGTHGKEKESTHGKVSQRIHELSYSNTRKEFGSPPSSRSSSERSTPERTFLDRKTPERSKSERSSVERTIIDRKTPERSSSEKGSSGRSTPERKVIERGGHSHSSSERNTPERGSPERSVSPVDRRGNTKSRESPQPMKVSDRVKRAEVMFKKEGSPPATSTPKPVVTLGKGAPMKLVVGESFKMDFSPGGGVQLGSKVTGKVAGSATEESTAKSDKTSSIRSKFEEGPQDASVKPKKGPISGPLNSVNGAREEVETKPRSKTDTEALMKAAEIIRNSSGENETGRRRQPSMAELRGKNPSLKSEKGSPSSPRKSYRRLYVTHVKGSKALEVVEGALSDVAEVKQKVDEDGLQVQLVMKLPTL